MRRANASRSSTHSTMSLNWSTVREQSGTLHRELDMRLLIVSPTPTHPTVAGNRARVLALARHFQSSGHDVHFVWSAMEDGDPEEMSRFFRGNFEHVHTARAEHEWHHRIRRRWLRLIRSPAAYHWGVDDWFDIRILERLRALQAKQQFDAVVVEYVFLSRALEAWGPSTLKVIDTHDRFANRHQLYLDAGSRAGWFSTSEADEVAGLTRADYVIAIQESEAEHFRSILPKQTRVETIGHILQTPGVPHFSQTPAAAMLASANTINVDAANYFADSVLPLVRREIADFEFVIAGEVGNALADRPGLRKLGRVPHAATAYENAAIAVNPVRMGTGLNIKTVECLALGLPLIATSSGSRGLPAFADGAYVSVPNDQPELMAAAIVGLLKDPEQRRALSRRALEFAARWNAEQHAVLDRMFPIQTA
jgi:glycosyltransferase involved in cell wall biosynthesis